MVDIQELKEKLGNRAREIILNGLGAQENRSKKISCVYHSEKTPSMSWYEEGLCFNCLGCGETLDIFRYYTDFEHMSFQDAVKQVQELVGDYSMQTSAKPKRYELPDIEMNELSDLAVEYMAKRKIIKTTLDAWGVKERNWNGKPVYVFQYFDDKDVLRFVSYRGIGKGALKGGCEKNTEPILWGMNHIDITKPVVITEGQPDAMAVYQSGYTNVVSVPNGSNNFKWIDSCWEWIQQIPEWIVWADNDEPGIKFAEEVRRRLNNVKIVRSEQFKDANEVMYYEGEKKVIQTIQDALNVLPDGLKDLAQCEYTSYLDMQAEGIETGFRDYDYHVEDWKTQEITIIFGRNGEGKSTVVSQIMAHQINNNVKTFLYSGELGENKLQNWLYRQLCGNNKQYYRDIQTKYKVKREPKPEVIKAMKEWHNEKLYIFDRAYSEILENMDSFFGVMELAAKRFGVRLFIIDNLMSVLEENADSLLSDQANFVQRCKNFSIKNNCHVVLLAHPNKVKGEVSGEVAEGNLDKNDISGTGNIPNKADNIIAVERNWSTEYDKDCDVIITSLKDREEGQRKSMKYFFSKQSLRFYNESTKENVKYGWEKYLDKKIEMWNGKTQEVREGWG